MGSLLSAFQSPDELAGYQVLQVQHKSPAEEAGIEPFFDFIIEISHIKLSDSDDALLKLLQEHSGRPLTLTVYSCRTFEMREVRINPNSVWGCNGTLGLTIRYCAVLDALKDVRHVLKIETGSPAELAGLKAYTDYIIGADVAETMDELGFVNFLQENDKRAVNFFVYNIEDTFTRLVQVTPNSAWGGPGLLGCAVGSGILHRIPLDLNLQNSASIARFAVNSIVDAVVGCESLKNARSNQDEINSKISPGRESLIVAVNDESMNGIEN